MHPSPATDEARARDGAVEARLHQACTRESRRAPSSSRRDLRGPGRGVDLSLPLAWAPSWNFRGEALLLTAIGPACVLIVRRCGRSPCPPIVEPRLRARDAASALAAGLIAATVLRWSGLLQVVAWWSLPGIGEVGAMRACASVAFAGATAWLVCRGLWARLDEHHDVIAALGGTAGILLLQRGDPPFFYGALF